jgi:hypothetical protein
MASTANAQNKGCSNATLTGTYAYTSTGTITSPPALAGPVAEVGMQIFDGNGSTKAAPMLSSGGTIMQLVISGTYTVNADCTGTMTLQVLSPFQATINVSFVINNAGDEFQAMETNDGFVITRFAKRLYPGRSI